MTLLSHPIADLLPLMTAAEMASLRADIKAKGLLEPIHIYEGRILDGRNRYAACLAEGAACPRVEYTGDDPTGFVISKNKERRHLTPSQLSVLAAQARPFFAEEARKRQEAGINQHNKSLRPNRAEAGKSINHAAKMVGVGATTASKADRILREHPERLQPVVAGAKSINAAYQEIYAAPPGIRTTADPPRAVFADADMKIRNRKEHRVTAELVIRKILDDVEPQFRFWKSFGPKTIHSASLGSLLDRALKCRGEFSRLIKFLKEQST